MLRAMRAPVFVLILTLTAATAAAAELIEGIVIRVGDRVVTRTQYARRLRDLDREIEQSAPPEKVLELKALGRKNLTNDMISELLIKDRADRLAITVTEPEIKEAINRLKQQYGIQTDQQFEDSLRHKLRLLRTIV